MKYKSMIGLHSRKNILLIFGTTVVALLVSTSSSQLQMVSASVEGVTSGSNDSSDIMKFKQHKDNPTSPNPNQQAIDHINQAQSALQNVDTEGAQMHMDLAKQALGCSPMDPRGC